MEFYNKAEVETRLKLRLGQTFRHLSHCTINFLSAHWIYVLGRASILENLLSPWNEPAICTLKVLLPLTTAQTDPFDDARQPFSNPETLTPAYLKIQYSLPHQRALLPIFMLPKVIRPPITRNSFYSTCACCPIIEAFQNFIPYHCSQPFLKELIL